MRTGKRILAAVSLSACALAAMGTASASAAFAAPGTDANRAAEQIDRAVAGLPSGQDTQGSGSIGTDGVVSVNSTKPAASIAVAGKTVRISSKNATATGSRINGANRVYAGTARATDTAIRTTPGSVQMLTVMNTPAASTTQRFQLDLPAGTQLMQASDGYVLVESDGKVTGAVEAPWAKDATGHRLPTRYTLEGTTLVQQTDTIGAQFPVVADPKITFGWSVYLNFWGAEGTSWGTVIIAAGGVAEVAACATLGKLPSSLRTIATMICGAVGWSLPKVFQAVVSYYRNSGFNPNSCYQINLNSPYSVVVVDRSNCE